MGHIYGGLVFREFSTAVYIQGKANGNNEYEEKR